MSNSRTTQTLSRSSGAAGASLPDARVLRAVLLVIMALAAILSVRLVDIQLFRRQHFLQMAKRIEDTRVPLDGQPGAIRDRRGQILADSVITSSLKVDPGLFRQYEDIDEESRYLSGVLGLPVAQVKEKIKGDEDFVYLDRRVALDVADEIMARRLRGLTQDLEYKRVYPHGEVGCHLLGCYSSDHRPLEGLEYRYRFVLAGRGGTPLQNRDAWDRTIVGMENQPALPAVPGKDLVLTVDWEVQEVVDDALEHCWESQDPDEATALVMDPNTGEILALASRPDYDPNCVASAGTGVAKVDIPHSNLINLSVTREYEPGSTFKVLLTAAALESGAVSLTDVFHCPGTTELGGKPLKCWGQWATNGGHRSLKMAGMLAKSCSICAARTAVRVGAERYCEFLRQCGIGELLQSGLPAEGRGRLRRPRDMWERDVANMGFGQGVAVTDVQLAAAVSAVVNGGVLMQPYVVDRVLNADGSVYRQVRPHPIRRVCSEETSATVRRLLRGAVEHGTGRPARIKGVAVGGKTGTAQIWDPQRREYRPNEYMVSFVLVAPVDTQPQFVILVTARVRGRERHGSEVAAPVAREIAVYMAKQRDLIPHEALARLDDS